MLTLATVGAQVEEHLTEMVLGLNLEKEPLDF